MPETRNRLETLSLKLKKGLFQRLHTPPPGTRSHLLVAGMQRSGTNMTMEVIEQSLDTDVYHEYDHRAFSRYEMKAPAAIEALIESSRGQVFVIKALCELQDLSALMQRFAPARTVWILRHYEDVVNSMSRSFRNMAAQVKRIAADKDDEDEWLARGMSEATHTIVKTLTDPGITDTEGAALQWYFRNVLFFEQGFEQNPDVLLVFYEDLVTQPQQEFARIFQFAGLDFQTKYTQRINPHSIRKNRSPEISAEVRERCEDLYQRFDQLRADPLTAEESRTTTHDPHIPSPQRR